MKYAYTQTARISFIYVSVNKPRTKTGVHDSITIANTKIFCVDPGEKMQREKATRFPRAMKLITRDRAGYFEHGEKCCHQIYQIRTKQPVDNRNRNHPLS